MSKTCATFPNKMAKEMTDSFFVSNHLSCNSGKMSLFVRIVFLCAEQAHD